MNLKSVTIQTTFLYVQEETASVSNNTPVDTKIKLCKKLCNYKPFKCLDFGLYVIAIYCICIATENSKEFVKTLSTKLGKHHYNDRVNILTEMFALYEKDGILQQYLLRIQFVGEKHYTLVWLLVTCWKSSRKALSSNILMAPVY